MMMLVLLSWVMNRTVRLSFVIYVTNLIFRCDQHLYKWPPKGVNYALCSIFKFWTFLPVGIDHWPLSFREYNIGHLSSWPQGLLLSQSPYQ